MPILEIVCMANSRKLGGRCLAGLRLDGGGWVRPVSADEASSGALFPRHYMLEGGVEIRPLDVVRISLSAPVPQFHHPEN